ncbi:methionine aminopeptidase 1B, chloroplastic-like isoform X3 [Apium graveolens]|uniref:methionine aminopeptidase 1B, chloroplastic-like isoform X3 n=1 Tax=Apium graveolens TaxID=4045 RepID=UPI003D7B3218
MAATVNSSTLLSHPTLNPSTFVNGEASASSFTTTTLFSGGVCAYRTSEASHTASLKRGNVSARLTVPDHIRKPHYIYSTLLPEISSEYQIHNAEGIDNMRAACKLAARVLDYAGTLVRTSEFLYQQSVTTNEIDEAVHQMIIEAAAYPSPLGYGQFPKSVCTSVNECMYHGIPDSRKLQDGDIINIDVAVYLNGYHGDTSKTFLCGNVDDATKKLVKVTEECLQLGISVCKDGAPFQNIGDRICELAAKFGYGVDRFVGHGVGTVLHSQPLIFHDLTSLVQWLKVKLLHLNLFLQWEALSLKLGKIIGQF